MPERGGHPYGLGWANVLLYFFTVSGSCRNALRARGVSLVLCRNQPPSLPGGRYIGTTSTPNGPDCSMYYRWTSGTIIAPGPNCSLATAVASSIFCRDI